MKKRINDLIAILLAVCLSCSGLLSGFSLEIFETEAAQGDVTETTVMADELLYELMDSYTSFVLVRHKSLGGSHYAYTEGLSDELINPGAPDGVESNFAPGSQLVLLELEKVGSGVKRTETVLLESANGVIRDPDVSEDGTMVLFSWKKSREDDYHLYEYDLKTNEVTQLTFGSGTADFEGKYLPDGRIVFSSTRDIQIVDCWKTPVSNMYTCDADGSNIIRVGYDQVHTTYPTVTSDGRVIYTRWDYNDRSQMYVQGVFQMFPDGTNQTELFGNDSNFPTTLLHTREIPGTSDKYISIASGHHVYQAGKLVVVDVSKGRNNPDSVEFVVKDGSSNKGNSIDAYGQSGAIYKYPYAVNEDLFMCAYSANGWSGGRTGTPFAIYLFDMEGNQTELAPGSSSMPASQIVPIAPRTMFERASMVNYGNDTGTYYMANVYEGGGLEGVEPGSAKYLRVVALDYRSYAIGATVSRGLGGADPFTPISTGNASWDVKQVLGIVPIEEDGSALFKVPSEKPVYFQVLDEEGCVIQSMRSWSTLMPGESFSCVGCHEDKNTVPTAQSTVTMAMAKGVQELQPDLWQTGELYEEYDPYIDEPIGFDYLEEVQPILDESCIECHSDIEKSYTEIAAKNMSGADTSVESTPLPTDAVWKYAAEVPAGDGWYQENFDDSSWMSGHAPFGTADSGPGQIGTRWDDETIYLRTTFHLTSYQYSVLDMKLYLAAITAPQIYVNGQLIYQAEGKLDDYTEIAVTSEMKSAMRIGTNTIAVTARKSVYDGNFVGLSIETAKKGDIASVEIFPNRTEWSYKMSSDKTEEEGWNTAGFDDSGWSTASAPFGDRENYATSWNGSNTNIWIRKTFEIDDPSIYQGYSIRFNTFFDDNPQYYLNGQLIYDPDNWVDAYTTVELSVDVSKYLTEGTNVLAIYCTNTAGGRQIDTNLEFFEKGVSETHDTVFSLERTNVIGTRMKRYFPVSYLLLTNSRPSGTNWVGNANNKYTNWISSMSQCEMLDPYQFGAAKSPLIERLRSGHGNLTEEEIRTIEAWIDLGVPAYGTYDANNAWGGNEVRWAEQYTNKRSFFDLMDVCAKAEKAGLADTGLITIDYAAANGSSYTVTDSGLATLYVGKAYSAGDKITITLPEGEQHLMLCMNSMMGEELIYVPDGSFEYTIPSETNVYPNTWKNAITNTITARLPEEKELTEKRNLAQNIYDLDTASGAYPHATAKSAYNNDATFRERNAIDGFTANQSHGSYPYQSWGPENDDGEQWIQVDFGKEVYVDEVEVLIRADFPHDTNYISGTLEFSDGSTKDIVLRNTEEIQTFAFNTMKTSYVKINHLIPADSSTSVWASLTEVRVNGYVEEPEVIVTVDKSALEAIIAAEREAALVAEDYTQESWMSYINAFANGTDILSDQTATQAEVNAAVTSLAQAKENLVDAPKPVVKEALQIIVDAAAGLDEEEYTEESWEKAADALKAAQEVLNNENATQVEVDKAEADLSEAIRGLEIKPIDKEKLQEKITEAEALEKDIYTEESWSTLETVLEEAKEVLRDKLATQEDADRMEAALSKAMAELMEKPEEMPELLADFDFDKDGDYLDGDYAMATGDYTLTAHGDGQALCLDGSGQFLTVTKKDGTSLLTGADELTVSFQFAPRESATNWAFFAAPDDSVQNYQKEKYLGIVDNKGTIWAERYCSNGERPKVAKTETGYDSWRHVTVVYTAASEETSAETILYIDGTEAARENSTVEIKELLGENSVLYIGKANWTGSGEYAAGLIDNYKIYSYALDPEMIMEEATRYLDRSGLEAAIEAAEKITEQDAYTKATWEAFASALTEAKTVLEKEEVSQAELNTAANELDTAREALVKKADTEELEAKIAEAEGLDETLYTEDSWAKLEEKLAEAKEILTIEDVSQSRVDSALRKLEDAVAALTEAEPPAPPKLPYVDVNEEDWFYDAVYYNYFAETMTGMDPTHFGPYGQLSRAQFALILYRMAGEPEAKTDKTFADITGDEWYGRAVLWAAQSGVVNGYENGFYGPGDNITREQMALMMYRYADYLKQDIANEGDLSKFSDGETVSPFAAEALKWAADKGIITGKGEKEPKAIDPQGETARCEAAAIIRRFMAAYEE